MSISPNRNAPARRGARGLGCAAGIVLLAAWPLAPASAADTTPDRGAPLSAIDWLSDSVATPVAMPAPGGDAPSRADIATSALPEQVTVTPLGGLMPDAVGLQPAAELGLPATLWGRSASADIAGRITRLEGDMLPATRALYRRLLIAALDPPADSGPGARLFLARIDALLAQGMLDDAEGLLARAGPTTPQVFRRWFDTTLLLGSEDRACATLRTTPDLAPTFPARIFCLARSGDWDTAALTLDTAKALGLLDAEEDALLGAFLHIDLDDEDGANRLPPPSRPTPLEFRIYEAIGEPMPTSSLPLAFAQADLRDNLGWKAQLEAAERLARAGALPPERLNRIYTDRLPAASGGVWDRVEAYQRFDMALTRNDPQAVAATLAPAWAAMEAAELEVPFATLFGARLASMPLTGKAAALAFRIGLLSPEYESIARTYAATTPEERFLAGLARGDVAGLPAGDDYARAVAEGFNATSSPVRLQSLVSEDRLGEAILRAMGLLTDGANGDLDEVSDAFAFFRAAGLEETARTAALQLLILDRRG